MKGKNLKISALLKGITVSLALVICGIIIALTYIGLTSNKTYYFSWAYFFVMTLAIIAGGFTSGYKAGSMGWLHGGLLGLIYSAVTFIVSFFLLPEKFVLTSLVPNVLFCAFFGAFGGIIGVNLAGRRRYVKNSGTFVRKRFNLPFN